MTDDSDELLEKWLAAGQELLAARKGSKREQQLEERLKLIEEKLGDRPAAERREALAELDDEERELLAAHRAGKLAPGSDDGVLGGKPPAGEEPPKPKVRPGRKTGQAYLWDVDEDGRPFKTEIAHVYSGADEPDEVEIPADDPDDDPDGGAK